MPNELFNELSAQLIETSKWRGMEQGVVSSIGFMTSQKLTCFKGDICREELQKIISNAKKSENFILRYLEIDNIPKNQEITDFSPPKFSLTKENLLIQKDFYENILNLYFLRNPTQSRDLLQSFIEGGNSIQIDFGADQKQHRYFIRRIYIINISPPEKKHDEHLNQYLDNRIA